MKDKVKGSARRGEDKRKIGKAAFGAKKVGAAGTAAELDESTKKGLGKTEDKVWDRLAAGDELDKSTKKGLGKTEEKIPDRLKR